MIRLVPGFAGTDRMRINAMGRTKDIKRYLKNNLDKRRYEHTLNTRHTAEQLAKAHVCFESRSQRRMFLKKVRLAALLHDADKGQNPERLWQQLAAEGSNDLALIKPYREVWHAFSAAITARDRFGVTDPDLLNALRYHTTGRAGMSDLEKIIYLADYIEPGRHFPGVEEIRQASQLGLDEGCLAALRHAASYLQQRGAEICPYTLDAGRELSRHGNTERNQTKKCPSD